MHVDHNETVVPQAIPFDAARFAHPEVPRHPTLEGPGLPQRPRCCLENAQPFMYGEHCWQPKVGQSWASELGVGKHSPAHAKVWISRMLLASTEGTWTDLNTFIVESSSAPAAECSGLRFSVPLRRLQDWREGEGRATDQQRLFSRARNMYLLGWRGQAQAQGCQARGLRRSHSSKAGLLAPTRMRTRQRTRWAAWVWGGTQSNVSMPWNG